MIKYEVSGIKRIRDYRFLLNLLSQYSIRQINYKNDERGAALSFSIPKYNASELEKRLKESKLVFKVLK